MTQILTRPVPAVESPVFIPVQDAILKGDLTVPLDPEGVVIFAHGTTGHRCSLRQQHIAGELQRWGFATLLLDMLTEREEQEDRFTHHLRFDLDLLTTRLGEVTEWLMHEPALESLPVGYFGTGTGSGASLRASTRHPGWISAIVCCGGRPDLAEQATGEVTTPTLLLAAEHDQVTRDIFQLVRSQMTSTRADLQLIDSAGPRLEDPGAVETVAALTCQWFSRYLS